MRGSVTATHWAHNPELEVQVLPTLIFTKYGKWCCMFTVYKTTNLINDKIYVGVHKTNEPNDDYLGSGFALRLAIDKYGRHNFKKEILYIFQNMEDAYLKESEIVNKDFVKRSDTYNLVVGGTNYGWHFSNSTGKNNSSKCRVKMLRHLSKIRKKALLAIKYKVPEEAILKNYIPGMSLTKLCKIINNGVVSRSLLKRSMRILKAKNLYIPYTSKKPKTPKPRVVAFKYTDQQIVEAIRDVGTNNITDIARTLGVVSPSSNMKIRNRIKTILNSELVS